MTLRCAEQIYATAEDLDRIAVEAAEQVSEITDEERAFSIGIVPIGDHDKLVKREREVLGKYRALIKDLTKEEELEVLGLTFKQIFPPVERDVEKLIIDLNIVIFRYMQTKMESSPEIRAETIRSTAQSALRKVSGALLMSIATDEGSPR